MESNQDPIQPPPNLGQAFPQMNQAAFAQEMVQDNFGWGPVFTDYNQLLEQIKIGEEMITYESMLNLQQSLSIASSETLKNFPLEGYLPELVKILQSPMESDLSNEINMFAIQCLTNLMDIFQNIGGSVVAHGAVKCITDVLERTMGFIDLNEACIKCLEKISLENPYAILTSGSIALILNMMDFFEITTQKKILSLILNVSRHAATDNEIAEHLIPILPSLCMVLQARGDHAQSKIEIVSNITLKICECVLRIVSAITQFDKVTTIYQMIGDSGIINCLLEKLHYYCIIDAPLNQANMMQQLNQKNLTQATVQNILKIIALCCKFTFSHTVQFLDSEVFKMLEVFLPSEQDLKKNHFSSESYPFIQDTVNLIDCIFPDRKEEPLGDHDKPKIELTIQKRDYFQSSLSKLVFVAERLLPKIFTVFDNNFSPQLRSKTLQLIDKMIQLFNDELLNNFIEPYAIAKFLFVNLRTPKLQEISTSILIADKLMKTNPKTYALPLIREGVSNMIKNVDSMDKLEAILNLKFEAQEVVNLNQEEYLQKTKAETDQKEGLTEEQKQEEYHQSLQNYLHLVRQQALLQQTATSKPQIDTATQLVSLAQHMTESFFENNAFKENLNQWYGEEFKMLETLRQLGQEIIQEAQNDKFNQDKTTEIVKKLCQVLTKSKIMNFEFKESGILEAVELLLSHTPSQIKLHLHRKKQGEEIKHSEEMQLTQMIKQSEKVQKKEARSYILRLKTFAYYMLQNIDNCKPFVRLVQLCHDILSHNEHVIFDTTPQSGLFSQSNPYDDPNQSINALRQLTKRVRVNIVYDQHKFFLKDHQTTEKMETDREFFSEVPEMTAITKSLSQRPAFANLAGNQSQSQVFTKRSSLYQELKQVLISVEQCANLTIIEDFLRNKVKTAEDVKNLTHQPMPSSNSFYSYLKKYASKDSEVTRDILERFLSKIQEMLDNDYTKDDIIAEGENLADAISEDIVSLSELTEDDQTNLIRHIEIQTLQMVDEHFTEKMQAEDQQMQDEQQETNEQKVLEIQRILERLRQFYKTKKQDDKKMLEEEKLKQVQQIILTESIKEEQMQLDTHQEEEEKKQEQLLMTKEVEMKEETEDSLMEDASQHQEKRDEVKKIMQAIQKQKQRQAQRQMSQEVELNLEDSGKESLATDLEKLIKEGGEDIDFEFYHNGQIILSNQTIFELLRSLSNLPPQKHEQNAHTTIYFLIKDKSDDISLARKDSLMEFAKRDRTRSEAVDDFSVSTVNQMVQQMVHKDIPVFTTKPKEQTQEFQQLEQALKILKVLNFISKNVHLLTNQGINFLIHQNQDQDQKSRDQMPDFDLQVGVSELSSNLFHHHKLDSYIMRNIQDPYTLMGGTISDVLNQIFRNCSFLFPFQTRQLFFKLISFIGSIDMNRSIFFLRQYIKSKKGKMPQEDKNNPLKFQKQKIIVDRSRIIDSACAMIKQINKRAFLEIQYKDEAGTGLGPTLEFYCLLANDLKTAMITGPSICQPQLIWRKGMSDNSLFPSPISISKMSQEELKKVYEIFRLAGIFVAKSISDDRLIDLPLSSLFWDLLLGKKMNIFDLERIDSDLFKIFSDLQMVANRKREVDKQVFMDQEHKARYIANIKTASGSKVEDLCLTFTLPGQDSIELKPNGKSIDVTLDSLQEFIDLVMHFTFSETVKLQIQAFKKGFNSIFPIENLNPFSTQNEMEDMICGTQRNNEEWTIQKLADFVSPAHGYHSKSQQYLHLLQMMSELNHEERRLFLKFVTGSPRLPQGGFSALDPKLTVVLKKPINPLAEDPNDILPSVMTCQNFIKLPSYSTYEQMKAKFKMAYEEGSNNFTLS